MAVNIHPSWLAALQYEFQQPYFQAIEDALNQKHAQGVEIYPPESQIFHAFDVTPFDHVKVVILGQDPYHGPGQAHGLSFSVPEGVAIPPSLRNIYKEMRTDLVSPDELFGPMIPTSGDLTRLAKQGVLLLNSILTVTASEPVSHRDVGREQFTDAVLTKLSEQHEGIIFVLRGAFAKSKRTLIDLSKHTVLEAPHPSPLSAYRGFFGSKPFSTINSILESQGQTPINRLDR